MSERTLSWRDRLALRIMAWIASCLMTDALGPERRKELGTICTSIQVTGKSERFGDE